MKPLIRPYTSNDRLACHRVFFRAVRDGTAEFYKEAQRKVWAPQHLPDTDSPDKLLTQWCYLAEIDNIVVGFMSMTKDGYVDMAFVHPDFHGCGIADAIYAKLAAQAHDASLETLTVHASHLARRFFTKHGWTVLYGEHHPENGQVYERFYMSRSLNEVAQ